MNEIKDKKYSFPIEQKLSNEYLKENFWKCIYTSAEEPLQYWIILPNNVKPTKLEPIKLNDLGLVNIGQYTRIDGSPYLEVEVVYEHCQYEMNTSDWLIKKLAMMGEYVLEKREIEGKSTGIYLDILTSKTMPSGEEIISRFTTLKDYDKKKAGANYFCIKASCIEKDYENLADSILQIVSNWDLFKKSDWQMAENINTFDYDFSEKLMFYAPVSWEIKYEENNNIRISRFILSHNIDNENKGVINAFFYDLNQAANSNIIYEKSFERLSKLDDFKSDLSELTLLKKIQNPHIKELWQTKGIVEYSKENFSANIEIYILKTEKGWYYFELIGPKPNLENHYWEIKKRCIEMILSSFLNLDFTKTKKFSFLADNNYTPQFTPNYLILNKNIGYTVIYQYQAVNSKPIEKLMNDEGVIVLKYHKGDWCLVQSKKGNKGYIHDNDLKYINTTKDEKSNENTQKLIQNDEALKSETLINKEKNIPLVGNDNNITTQNEAYLQSNAALSEAPIIIQRLEEGEKLEVLSMVGNWYYVQTEEAIKGYIHKTKIKE